MNPQTKIVIASERGISIRSRDDISEVVGASLGRGLILTDGDLGPDFFDLRTGLAGELIQKFVNYRVRVAIVVETPTRTANGSPNSRTSTQLIPQFDSLARSMRQWNGCAHERLFLAQQPEKSFDASSGRVQQTRSIVATLIDSTGRKGNKTVCQNT